VLRDGAAAALANLIARSNGDDGLVGARDFAMYTLVKALRLLSDDEEVCAAAAAEQQRQEALAAVALALAGYGALPVLLACGHQEGSKHAVLLLGALATLPHMQRELMAIDVPRQLVSALRPVAHTVCRLLSRAAARGVAALCSSTAGAAVVAAVVVMELEDGGAVTSRLCGSTVAGAARLSAARDGGGGLQLLQRSSCCSGCWGWAPATRACRPQRWRRWAAWRATASARGS
jgi:hypothetical protein